MFPLIWIVAANQFKSRIYVLQLAQHYHPEYIEQRNDSVWCVNSGIWWGLLRNKNETQWAHTTILHGIGGHLCNWKWVLRKHDTTWCWSWFLLRSNLHTIPTVYHRKFYGAWESALCFSCTPEWVRYFRIQEYDYWMSDVPIFPCINSGFNYERLLLCLYKRSVQSLRESPLNL